MRQFVCGIVLVLVLAFALTAVAIAAENPRPRLDPDRQLQALNEMADELNRPYTDVTAVQRVFRGDRLNQAFVVLTGEAINPLFGITALGIYNYVRTDESLRRHLPLHDQPVVWIPLLIIVLLMLFNSTICEAVPFLKVPLNALGDIVNKAGAAAVLPLVVKMFADAVAQPMGEYLASASSTLFPMAYAAEASVSGTLWTSAGWLIGALCGAVVYLTVWMTFNVIDVLILICPFPGVDALLKSFRLTVLGVLTGGYHLNSWLGVAIAAVIVLVSLLVAGWSFRLSVFGWLFSTDIIFRRRGNPRAPFVTAFAADGLCRRFGVPIRTLGRLEKTDDGGLCFTYRPWLFRRRREIRLGDSGLFACGVGLLNPFLVEDATPDAPWLRLPPRYSGQDGELVAALGLKRPVSCGISGTLRTWLKEAFSSGVPCAADAS